MLTLLPSKRLHEHTLSDVLFALSFRAISSASPSSTEFTKSVDILVNQSKFLFLDESGAFPESGDAEKPPAEVGEVGEPAGGDPT